MIQELVLFGVTGDLARQKLIPALFNLYRAGGMSKKSSFVGFGRKKFSKIDFQNFIEDTLLKNKNVNAANAAAGIAAIRDFSAQWTYVESELGDTAGYRKLASILAGKNSVIYISLPPAFQYEVSQLLIANGVISKKGGASGRRLALEKPYGFNIDSAAKLDSLLTRKLREDQILRVDHYAGKQALVELEQVTHQGIFENLLNSKNYGRLRINFTESLDVSMRGSFYDSVGALNDVVQNHVLHMLATILALPEFYKGSESASSLRSKALSLFEVSGGANGKSRKPSPVLAQYEGFRSTEGVKPDSLTETFFLVHGEIQKKGSGAAAGLAKRWKGLKIELVGGKALAEAESSIVLYPANKKEKEIRIAVNGYGTRDAYEQIFLDAFYYDKDRFVGFEQVKKGWEIVQKIKRAAGASKMTKDILIYKKGAYPQDISRKS